MTRSTKTSAADKSRAPKDGPRPQVKFKKFKLGECIDKLYTWEKEVEDAQKKLNQQLATTLDAIKMMRGHIMASFEVAELQGGMGHIAKSEIKQSVVPSVQDWDKVWAYIVKTKSFSLLQKRVSVEAWRERLNAKTPVPGIDPFTTTVLSVRKR